MRLFILQYQGMSWQSQMIKAVTWSLDSHSAIGTETGIGIEAWQKCGVSIFDDPWQNHEKNTPIDVYSLHANLIQARDIWNLARLHEGEDYDFISLAGFLPLVRIFWKDDVSKWFCSHFVAAACRWGGAPLFSDVTPLYKLYPGVLPWSPRLNLLGGCKDMDGYMKLVEAA